MFTSHCISLDAKEAVMAILSYLSEGTCHCTVRLSPNPYFDLDAKEADLSRAGLWDTALLTKSIREIHNYTRPLPSRQIESALSGAIYDPYVRWLVWEGIGKWWKNDLEDWLACDSPTLASGESQTVFASPLPSRMQMALDRVVCPLTWAPPVHNYCCSHVFPPKYDMEAPPEELNTAAYYGKVQKDKVVESLLAKGGIRLAATLNTLFADDADIEAFGLLGNMLEESS